MIERRRTLKMKKYFILIELVFCIMFLGACGNVTDTNLTAENVLLTSNIDDASNLNLEFEKDVYRDREIEISYPQISNLNSELSNSINQKIKQDALSVLDFYSGEIEDLSVEISYTQEIINNSLISICFEGIVHVKNTAYPNNVFYTSNIDGRMGERLTTKDIIKVNLNLIEIIKKNAKYVQNDKNTNEELTSEISRKLENYDSSNMLTDIEKSGTSESEIYVYLKQDSIGFSLPVLHALGDYANFEVEYNYLLQFLKF